ncbi:MAG: hypothetical protein EOP48_23175 [Sphingobacteriales bacterium]|nr:MAG: hypothetical protein EOP48_23175 [Sphingobacteriales bacterium]
MSLLLALIAIWALIAILTLRQVALAAASALVVVFWVVLGVVVPCLLSLWALVPLILVVLVLNVGGLRRAVLTTPVFGILKKTMPSMSVTEREALEAGTTWWEKELFSGKPDWNEFAQIGLPQLSVEEQSFLDNEVSELCGMLNEWDIYNNRKDLPPEAWQFLKDKGFFGLIIPKEFGGRELRESATASHHSPQEVMAILSSTKTGV